jgi:hypothetical protein
MKQPAIQEFPARSGIVDAAGLEVKAILGRARPRRAAGA